MSNYKISRRLFMTSAGTVFTLPLLESLVFGSKALAQAAQDPRRYVMIYFPNGTYNLADHPLWTPPRSGALSASNTADVFTPFSSFYQDFSVVAGLNSRSNKANNNGDDHVNSAQAYLTASIGISSTTNSFEHVLGDRLGKAAFVLSGGDPSYDQEGDGYISYRNGKGQRGMSNPGDLYRDLLKKVVPSSTGGGGTTTPAPVVSNKNKSILDSSLADISALSAKVGKNDRLRLDEFFSSVRNLENKVAATTPTPVPTTPTGGTSSSCVTPILSSSSVDTNQVTNPSLLIPRFYAFNDMIKIAFACDITRSVSIMVGPETTQQTFTNAPSNLVFQGADIGGGLISHTAISHPSPTSLRMARCCTRDRVLFQIVTDLISKLKGANDPSGSRILDNTVIQAGYGVCDGNHGGDGAPIFDNGVGPMVLAGGRNFMNPGNAYTLNSYDISDLYYTINNYLGAGLTSFQGGNKLIKL